MNRALAGLALAAAVLTACGQEKKAEAPAAAVESSSGGGGSATAVAGPNVTVTAGTPANQPVFAAQYPGATVVTTYTAVENGKRGGIYAFTTTDPADKVFAFYRTRAEAAGLGSQTNVETAGGHVYGAQGPAGDVSVVSAPQQGKTFVQVTWSATS